MGSQAQFVSAADITRNFGMWQDKTAGGPVIVTSHGRPRVALVAIDDYERLSRDACASGHDGDATAETAILLDHIPEAFVSFDTQLNFRAINAVARAYWAVLDRSLIGQGLLHAFPLLDNGLIVGQLRRVLTSHEETTFDAPSHLYPDRMLRFRVFPYPGGIAMIFNDLASRLEEQREAARRLSLRFAAEAHGGICAAQVTPRGTFSQVGRPFAALVNRSVAQLLGLGIADILALDRRDPFVKELEMVFTGSGAHAFESALLVDGVEQPVRVGLAEVREGFAIISATVLLTALP